MIQQKMCPVTFNVMNGTFYYRLNIKQAPSKTFISGEDNGEVEWAEFRLDETNRLTINKQQVFF